MAYRLRAMREPQDTAALHSPPMIVWYQVGGDHLGSEGRDGVTNLYNAVLKKRTSCGGVKVCRRPSSRSKNGASCLPR